MTKEEFFKKNDPLFLPFGFTRTDEPQFLYEKRLVSEKDAAEMGLRDKDVPCLLFGDTGINRGYCIYTGAHFVWFNSSKPDEAVEFANKIVSFEEV